MTRIDSAVRALAALGFTDLEARCWAFLARKGPSTGYAVAQGIARPAANTYQALASLDDKGAVVSVPSSSSSSSSSGAKGGRGKAFRALPAEQLLAQLERGFTARKQAAADALRGIVADDEDDRVWTLSSRAAVIERFHELVAGAREVVLAVVFPQLIDDVLPALEAAAARGVDVVVKGYAPFAVQAVTRVLSNVGHDALPRFGGQELGVVVDGQATLFALLGDDDTSVVQAITTRSPFLAMVHHNGLATELAYTALLARQSPAARAEAIAELRHPFDTPGYRALLERAQGASSSSASSSSSSASSSVRRPRARPAKRRTDR